MKVIRTRYYEATMLRPHRIEARIGNSDGQYLSLAPDFLEGDVHEAAALALANTLGIECDLYGGTFGQLHHYWVCVPRTKHSTEALKED